MNPKTYNFGAGKTYPTRMPISISGCIGDFGPSEPDHAADVINENIEDVTTLLQNAAKGNMDIEKAKTLIAEIVKRKMT